MCIILCLQGFELETFELDVHAGVKPNVYEAKQERGLSIGPTAHHLDTLIVL